MYGQRHTQDRLTGDQGDPSTTAETTLPSRTDEASGRVVCTTTSPPPDVLSEISPNSFFCCAILHARRFRRLLPHQLGCVFSRPHHELGNIYVVERDQHVEWLQVFLDDGVFQLPRAHMSSLAQRKQHPWPREPHTTRRWSTRAAHTPALPLHLAKPFLMRQCTINSPSRMHAH